MFKGRPAGFLSSPSGEPMIQVAVLRRWRSKATILPSEPQKLGDYFRGFVFSKALAPFEDADLEWG